MDRTKFYGVVRKTLYGTFFPGQKTVDGYEAVLYANEIRYRLPKIQLAYVLATAYHETGHTMTPQAERGPCAAKGVRKLRQDGKDSWC